MMAVANDIGYEEVFRFPLRGKITSNDLFVGISGSGNSKNVVNAAEYAKECGAKVVGITGYKGGKLKKLLIIECMLMNVICKLMKIFI